MRKNQLRRNNFILDSKKIKRTPSGGIKVSAYLSRTGLQVYYGLDGKKSVEFRPAEEVFSSASLESYKGAPITDGHPRNPVDPTNWSVLSRGHVGEVISPVENKFIRAELSIQEKRTVQEVLSGELREISCGYTCDLEEFPGEVEGEPYDVIQRNIRINHVALLPFGQARGGRDLTVRFDSKGNLIMPKTENDTIEEGVLQHDQVEPELEKEEVEQEDKEEEKQDDNVNDNAPEDNKEEKKEEEPGDRLDSLEQSIDNLSNRLASIETAISTKNNVNVEPLPEVVINESLNEQRCDVDVDKLVNEKINLIDAARTILKNKELVFDGLSSKEIKVKVLEEKKLNLKEDASDEYIDGCFDVVKLLEEKNKPATKKVDKIEKQLNNSRQGNVTEQSGGLKELQETWAARLNKGDK